MNLMENKSRCHKLSIRMTEALADRLDTSTGWMQRHIAKCPRCQKALKNNQKLRLAMMMLKTDPQKNDLLIKANTQALQTLKQSLRLAPKAETLRHIKHRVPLRLRLAKYFEPVMQAAVCALLLIIIKTGVMTAITKFQCRSEKAIEQYYAQHLDEDMLDDLL